MCGVLGYIGSIPEYAWGEAHTLLSNIFIKSQTRGRDASGFSTIHCVDEPRLITEKRPISSEKFVDRSNKYKSLRRYMPRIFIGHTRLSTSGDPSMNRNNHPFNSQRYSLVHNGGITGWQDVAKETGIGKKMRSLTDSEMLIHLLEEQDRTNTGFQHMMDNIPHTSRVALGVIGHHPEQDRRLYLFRNGGSPLHLLTIPQWKTIMFASTDWILKDALKLTYGDYLKDIIRDYGITIMELPTWKLSEFGFDGTTPIPLEHYDITENKKKMGFSQSPIIVGGSTATTTTKRIPMVGPSESSGDTSVGLTADRSITEDMLKDCSDRTKKCVTDLSFTIQDTLPVLESIRTNPMMQNDELDHFKKWMKRVF